MLAPLPELEMEEIPSDLTNTTQGFTQSKPKLTTVETGWKGDPPRSVLELVLRCAFSMMKKKVNTAPKDKIGIVIYNTVS